MIVKRIEKISEEKILPIELEKTVRTTHEEFNIKNKSHPNEEQTTRGLVPNKGEEIQFSEDLRKQDSTQLGLCQSVTNYVSPK